MKIKKYQGGYYYGDPFIDFFLPTIIVVMVVLMVVGIVVSIVDPIEEHQPLSPGVYAISGDTVCEQVEGTSVQRCTITLDVPDQYGADEIQATNHVLMLEAGEERAEVINLIDEPEVVDGEGGQEDDGMSITISVE